MAMEQREIEVTLVSAQNLKKVNTFGRMAVYCVAWIYPNMKVSSPMDTRGDLNPTWNATLKLTADERLLQGGNPVLHIDLYNHGSFSTTYVGSSSIPLSGLKATVAEQDATAAEHPLEGEAGSSSSSLNFMTVPVLRPSGRTRGTLNLSLRLGELINYREYPTGQNPYPYPGQNPYPYPGQNPYPYPPGYGQYSGGTQPYPIYQQPPYYSSGGYGRSGLGAGLLGGALGGFLLGSILGDGGGFGGCGGF